LEVNTQVQAVSCGTPLAIVAAKYLCLYLCLCLPACVLVTLGTEYRTRITN